MASNNHLVRSQNKQLVLKQLFQHESLFAADIVKATGISMVTVNSLIRELLAEDTIIKGPLQQKNMGRPAVTYQLNVLKQQPLLLCLIDIEGELFLHTLLVDIKGRILGENQRIAPRTPTDFQKAVTQQLHNYPQATQIALCIPGKINQGIVTSSWYEVFDLWPLNELMAAITTLPFYCQNDAHLLTIGACIHQGLSLRQTIVGIYNPEQSMPGITLLVNETLLEGQRSLAGEAKFLPGYLDQGVPETRTTLVNRLAEVIPFYNAAFAPHCLIVASTFPIESSLRLALAQQPILQKQPNEPAIYFVNDLKQALIFGLHWLIFHNTPYSLA